MPTNMEGAGAALLSGAVQNIWGVAGKIAPQLCAMMGIYLILLVLNYALFGKWQLSPTEKRKNTRSAMSKDLNTWEWKGNKLVFLGNIDPNDTRGLVGEHLAEGDQEFDPEAGMTEEEKSDTFYQRHGEFEW